MKENVVTALEALRDAYEGSLDVVTDNPNEDRLYRKFAQNFLDDLNEIIADEEHAVLHNVPVYRNLHAVLH